MTGDELYVKVEQLVPLDVNTRMYRYKFLVCPLRTKAKGIIGMGFRLETDARLQVKKGSPSCRNS